MSGGAQEEAEGSPRQRRGSAGGIGGVSILLRDSPVMVPTLAVVALFVAWATDQGGYPVTHWAPGGLVVLAVLAMAAWWIPRRGGGVPRLVGVAIVCLALYTAWSFLSILWAGVPGDAWEGADRTLLYLLVFALFATWRIRAPAAAALIVIWILALAGLAAFVLAHLNGLGAAGLQSDLPGGRLVYPSGYVNANAAQWMMAAFPAMLLARTGRLMPALRGLLAAAAVLLVTVALLSLSRGSLFASAALLLVVFVVVPGRLRTFAVAVPVVAGVGAAIPWLLKVGDALQAPQATPAAVAAAQHAVHRATAALLVAAVLVGVAVTLAALFEGGRRYTPALRGRLRRVTAVLAAGVLVGGIGGAVVAVGNPFTRVSHEWETFTSPKGYAANTSGNRLLSGLGSSRYDFYRVALDEFAAHPLTGIGADNFSVAYLRKGHSDETPRYPHSVEVRTLAETGLVGALIALVGLAAALLAAARAMRRSDELGATVAAAAMVGFGYWGLHGSVDWFFEYAGLGAPAFALLGIACALDRRRFERAPSGGRPRRMRTRALPSGRVRVAAGAPIVAVIACAFAGPWLSGLEEESAGRVWVQNSAVAYRRLEDAASLDPLSGDPYMLAASIALRNSELGRARRDFELALGRSSENEYATLELGAIASAQGELPRASRLLTRAQVLYPRGVLAREGLQLTREGTRISTTSLDQLILQEAQALQ